MPTTALINRGEELEVNLVEPTGEVDNERRPVGPAHLPAHEALRQPPPEQIRQGHESRSSASSFKMMKVRKMRCPMLGPVMVVAWQPTRPHAEPTRRWRLGQGDHASRASRRPPGGTPGSWVWALGNGRESAAAYTLTSYCWPSASPELHRDDGRAERQSQRRRCTPPVIRTRRG